MKLGGHRPGSLTAFVDGATGETLLQIAADPNGDPRVAYRLFDCDGNLVEDSDGFHSYPEGLSLSSSSQELLLHIPPDPSGDVLYRLYNPEGRLLTCSDGSRTQILGGLRLEGAKAPSRTKQPSKA
ncbi:MAG TPA: hypothetical protein VI876_05270 [Dehalococcoidia bacterium]|jgi:hypothetical protein|nr:hypothetical protein [Dehalococcoidia bacterium]